MATNKRKLNILGAWLYEYSYGLSYETLHYLTALDSFSNIDIFPLEGVNRTNKFMKSLDSQLIDTVNLTKPDLAIIKPYKNTLQPETIKYLTDNLKIKTIGLMGDDEKYFDTGDYQSIKFAGAFNLLGTNYKPAVQWYEALHQKAVLFQYGANQKVFKKKNTRKYIDASFVGIKRDERISFLNYLVHNKIKLHVWGKDWKDDQSSIINHAYYVDIINASKINLSVSKDIIDGHEILQIKGRDFEVPMCGGFLLTTHNDALKDYFIIGKEIETYRTNEECLDKIKYYLKNDWKREQIAQAGYKRSQKDHCYDAKFKKLIALV
jgi:hypothetical protein